MRTITTKLILAIILVLLLSIRLALFLTAYSIASAVTSYLVNILIFVLLSFLFFQIALPNQLKIFVLLAALIVVAARIGLVFFMSVVGERTLEKLGTWKVGEYTVVKQLDVGWTGPPYEASFLIESKLSGLIVKTSPVQQIDRCTFAHHKNGQDFVIDVCNQKVVEETDQIDR